MAVMETTLVGHYQVVKHLGGGGFGQTFLARDIHLPGDPLCVVKQLKPQTKQPEHLYMAQRLFEREAETLYKLGNHGRIPRLFAHFEQDGEFYLVQEFIEGTSLEQEITPGKQFGETYILEFLKDLLDVLSFVHEQQVIHRDIKPTNLIRRQQDCKIVLIDFGAVKQVSGQLSSTEGHTSLTVAIGSPGYMPNEQKSSQPHFSSDLYAVGIMCLQALSGLAPKELPRDRRNEFCCDLLPKSEPINPRLAAIIDKMVRYDYRQRYDSAQQAREDLEPLLQRQQQVSHSTTTIAISPHTKRASLKPLKSLSERISKLPITPQELRKWGIGAGIAVVSLVLIAVAKSLPSKLSSYFIAKANNLAESGQYHEAINNYANALRFSSDNKEIFVLQGLAFGELKQTQQMLESCNQALELQPSSTEALYCQAQALQNLGREGEALAAYEKLLQLQPNLSDAWNNQGEILLQLAKNYQALAAFDKAILYQSNHIAAWSNRGKVLLRMGQYRAALGAYEKALSIDPQFLPALLGHGDAFRLLKRNEAAIAQYQKVIEIEPTSYLAWYNQGLAHLNLRNYEQALTAFDQAMAIKPDYQTKEQRQRVFNQYLEALLEKANVLQLIKRDEAAIAQYDKVLALKPDLHNVWYKKGLILLNLQKYKQAVTAFDEAIKIKPDYQAALEKRQQVLSQLEMKDE